MWYRVAQVTKVWYQRVVEEDGKKGVAELKIGDEQGINLVLFGQLSLLFCVHAVMYLLYTA